MTKARSNAVAEAAKGDLSVGTGTNLAGILAIGSNGDTLVADSSTSTGLRYQSAYNGNQIINGGYDNWQRGTSFTSGGVYCADRWFINALIGTATVSRDTDVPTGLAGQFSIKQLTAAGSSFAQWSTPLETATILPLRGQTVVLSWYMKVNATWSGAFGPVLFYSNSTDTRASQTTSVTFNAVTTVTPTTSWARYYGTFTVPSDAQGLMIQFNPGVAQASGASLNMAGVQLEIGSVPTSFKRAGGTIQGELAACQRYYNEIGGVTNTYLATGLSYSTTQMVTPFSFPVMRVAPSASVATVGDFQISDGAAAFFTATALSFSDLSPTTSAITGTIGTASLTVRQPSIIKAANANGKIRLSAEL
jgi:hypothetical protein